MTITKADTAVLAYLRERGTGQVTVREIAAAAGLKRVTTQVSLYVLNHEDLICITQWLGDVGSDRFVIRHLHPGPDPCEDPLPLYIQEDNDGPFPG